MIDRSIKYKWNRFLNDKDVKREIERLKEKLKELATPSSKEVTTPYSEVSIFFENDEFIVRVTLEIKSLDYKIRLGVGDYLFPGYYPLKYETVLSVPDFHIDSLKESLKLIVDDMCNKINRLPQEIKDNIL